MGKLRLRGFATLVCALTLLLLVAGGVVTSTQSALTVPDWPLFFGSLIPPFEGAIPYEFAHRALAAIVLLASVTLSIWTWRAGAPRAAQHAALAATAAVAVEAALGGIAVRFLDPRGVALLHGSLSLIFFALTTAVVPLLEATPLAQAMVDDASRPSLHASALAACGALFVESMLGASVRHVVIGIVPHIAMAALATVAMMWAAGRVLLEHSRHTELRHAALWAISFTFSQVFLGLGAYMSRIATAGAAVPSPLMVWFTVAHAASGAVALAASVALAIAVFRNVRRPGSAPENEGLAVA